MKQINLCRNGKTLFVKRLTININKIPLVNYKVLFNLIKYIILAFDIKYVCSDSSNAENREWATSLKNSHFFEDLRESPLINNLNDDTTTSQDNYKTINKENTNSTKKTNLILVKLKLKM